MYKTITLKARMSEKAYGLSQSARTYVFEVPAGLNRHDVARAVETQFEVKVSNVNLTNIPGKAKRTIFKGGRAVKGRQSDLRKAYVRLIEGQSLPLFAAVEEAEAKEEATQAKVEKAVKKRAEKEEKVTTKSGRLGLRRAKKEDK